MATPSSYTKSISNDFPNKKVNLIKLKEEIQNSSITVAVDFINTDNDNCTIWFKNELPEEEEPLIDVIVSSHQGVFKKSTPLVNISEESTETGGNFSSKTIKVTSDSNQSSFVDTWWPHPISALSMKYNSKNSNEGDTISMILSPDTIIGTTTSDINSLPSEWTSKNYVKGECAIFNHSTFGDMVYTCINDTVSNEDPTNSNYWRDGFQIKTSTSSALSTMAGYYLSLDDGNNTDDLGRIISIESDKIYVEKAPINTYLTGTNIKQNIYILKDFEFGTQWVVSIGESKIGGSYLPARTIVRLVYNNKSSSTQSILGMLEYLY